MRWNYGLLDKVDNLDEAQPAKAKPKAAKAVSVAVQPKRTKALQGRKGKPSRAEKTAKSRDKPSRHRLPEGYELAGKCQDTLVG